MEDIQNTAFLAPDTSRKWPNWLPWLVFTAGTVLLGLVIFVWPVGTPEAQIPPLVKVLGRFHILALHLPIGIMALLALMEFAPMPGPLRASLAPSRLLTLWAGALGLLAAAVLGYFLGLEGGYQGANYLWHLRLEIAAAVFALLALALRGTFARGIYLTVLALSLVTMGAGAHFGGNMSHGDTFLTEQVNDWLNPKPKPQGGDDEPSGVTVFAAIIAPIFEAKCNSCHNEAKTKGGLRMDSYELLVQGGDNPPALVPGKAAESLLLQRANLPLDDDDHMPPDGKPQLTPEENKIIAWWIDQGASSKITVEQAVKGDQMAPLLKAHLKP